MSAIKLTNSLKSLSIPSESEQDLQAGRETLRQESAALLRLADTLDPRFTQAIDTILSRTGKVIVSGMGKSGHVAKKIAATFASTGTPAYFVHPAEASHGDLGMIAENDTVLLLSKSGEAPELRDLVNYCKRFAITLIACTMKPDSTLGRQADIILQLPDMPEACPNNQAPMTSATMTMAMGDALAVALMKRRGFSALDFRQYHPGGKLGGQLLAVSNVMQKDDTLPLVHDTANVAETQKIMSAKNFGCAIVVNAKNELVGFVSDGDIRRHLSNDLPQQNITTIMGTHPRTVAVDALSSAALALMNQHNITQLVVIEGKTPVGLLRLHDILRAGVA
jgi:arabinose-5-phosphate isomerase